MLTRNCSYEGHHIPVIASHFFVLGRCVQETERQKDRKRRKRGGQRAEKEGKGTAADPGRKEEKRKDMFSYVPGLYRYRKSVPASCRQAQRRTTKDTQAGHQKEGGGEEEGEREERGNTGTPKEKTNPAKNPAAFSDHNIAKTLYPNNQA